MANLDLDSNQAKFQIRSYQPGCIQVNDQRFTNSIILTPDEIVTDWPVTEVSELNSGSLEKVIQLKPDILLIGTGSRLILLPVSIYGNLINLGIGVEVMDTRAACFTFNALASENRRVAAALVIR